MANRNRVKVLEPIVFWVFHMAGMWLIAFIIGVVVLTTILVLGCIVVQGFDTSEWPRLYQPLIFRVSFVLGVVCAVYYAVEPKGVFSEWIKYQVSKQ